ncbi:uncharacterized protein CELE_F55G7.4 [Caenorhabditis elegans]|uniref:Uncharacterized protein n=1 Tax=Caenorhabditis elegans TaxID=6239 RepID=A7LPG2_CAEEL|nr:Uncharacterized protein CELE_F55G7.4 [Caenorhabditis elegans]CAO82050.3 Uncharacterized protein CELE_F55G7.4 [Caenorhabditis elegans]
MNTLHDSWKQDNIKVKTLNGEAASFITPRTRVNRSSSRESAKSKFSDIESAEEVIEERLINHYVSYPSPVHGSDVDETKVDLKIKNHAFDLSLKLEAASAFNKISTLSVHSGQDYALCIPSFSKTMSTNLHLSPKIRRSTSSCLRSSKKESLNKNLEKYKPDINTERNNPTSGESLSNRKSKKRSWDNHLHSSR